MYTLDQAEKITQLGRKSLINWKFKVSHDKPFVGKRGRPPIASEGLCKEMLEAVTLCDNENVAMRMVQLRQLVHERLWEEGIRDYGCYMKSETFKNFLKMLEYPNVSVAVLG